MAYVEITRAVFRQSLVERLGAAGLVFWRVDELNKIIQESLRFFNLLTGYWKTRVTLTTVAGGHWYVLPNAITSQMRVVFQSQPLSPVSAYDMDFGRPSWESETTTTGGDVPTTPKHFIIAGLNLLGIWPGDAAGNTALIIDGIASTPILTSDGSKLDIGQEEMAALLDYCQHTCAYKEAGKELASTKALMENFLKCAAERSAILKASATYKRYMGVEREKWQKHVLTPDAEKGAR